MYAFLAVWRASCASGMSSKRVEISVGLLAVKSHRHRTAAGLKSAYVRARREFVNGGSSNRTRRTQLCSKRKDRQENIQVSPYPDAAFVGTSYVMGTARRKASFSYGRPVRSSVLTATATWHPSLVRVSASDQLPCTSHADHPPVPVECTRFPRGRAAKPSSTGS